MIREVQYRMKVLRNGAEITELRWADSAPRVNTDSTAEIKSSMVGTFLPNENADLLRDELQPCMVIDGHEHPLGVFCPTTVKALNAGTRQIAVEGYDRAWRLKAAKTESLLHMAAGSGYLAQAEQLLAAAGIALVIKTDSGAVLPADREYELGSEYLAIVNQLLKEIGYREIWFDAQGWAHLEPYLPPSAARMARQYGGREIMGLPMGESYTDETDIFEAPNVFICVCSNADSREVLSASAANDIPTSAKSTFRRGMRIPQVTKVEQIADQAALQVYADRLRDESLLGTRLVSFYTPAEPGHGVGDIIGIARDELTGVYEETGWSITMEAGELMAHTARRTVIA